MSGLVLCNHLADVLKLAGSPVGSFSQQRQLCLLSIRDADVRMAHCVPLLQRPWAEAQLRAVLHQNEETYEMMGSSALQCMAVRIGEPTALGGAAVRGCGR